MALGDTTTLDFMMAKVYSSEGYIAPYERAKARFFDSCKDFKNGGAITGSGFNFVIRTKGSHSNGFVAESADFPTYVAPDGLNAEVDNCQWGGTVAWSEYAMRVIRDKGVIGAADVIADHVKLVMSEHGSLMNRGSLGDSTARLAVIQTTTDTLTTFVARNPENVFQLREGMRVDFVDSSGVKQGATETIDTINDATRTVTIGSARTLTAGWGVVQAGNTLLGMNGLRGTADDGTYQAVIYGLTKATDVEVKGQVLDATSGTQSISTSLLRKGCGQVKRKVELVPDVFWCNDGVLSAYQDHLEPSRIFTSGPGQLHDLKNGNAAKTVFVYGGKAIPFEVDNDLPARELFMFPKELWRKHIASPTNWIGDGTKENGSSSPIFLQATAASGTGYSLAKYAGVYGFGNLACLQPKGTLVIRSIADSELAGD